MAEQNQLFKLLVAGVVMVAVGITLTVGADIQNSVRQDVRETTTSANDTVAMASGTATLGRGYVISLTQCANATDNWNIGPECNISTNDPQNAISVSVNANSTDAVDTPDIDFRYTYDTLDHASVISGNSSQAFENLSKWQPTIGTVVAAGAIIAILFTSFIGAVYKRKTAL